jgi:putative FmdB family regulatory protein
MPLYEFACKECGAEFEKLVSRAAAISDVSCPSCGSTNVEDKISLFSSRSTGTTASSCAPTG